MAVRRQTSAGEAEITPDRTAEAISLQDLSPRSRGIAAVIWYLMKAISGTCRFRFHDPDSILQHPPDHPMIWIFWHNRIFALPATYRRCDFGRKGASLSSASRDGEIIAALVARLGLAAVRGSSSRRGLGAMLGLLDWIRAGYDVSVVPDGPRGPRYRLGKGVIKLAQMTNAKILPVRVEYRSWWTFRSWDRFRLPKPFTRVDVYFDPLVDVPSELTGEEFEEQRLRVESILNPNHETD